LPNGAVGGLKKLKAQAFRRCTTDCFSDGMPGLRLLGAWRTPSLRAVAMTAPYMHDGARDTLGDAGWPYDQADAGRARGTSALAPLSLRAGERDDLVAVLGSLTGTPGAKELGDPPPAPDGGAGGACGTSADGGAGDAN